MLPKLWLLLIWITVGAAPSLFAQKTLVFASDAYMPYNGDPKQVEQGYVIELLREIFPLPQFRIEYRLMPYALALAEVREGKIHGTICASPSEAPELIFPQEPCGIGVLTFYTRRGNPWHYRGMDSLNTIRLGVISGYCYGPEVNAYVKQNSGDSKKISLLYGDKALDLSAQMLRRGQIEVLLETESVFNYRVRLLKLNPQDFVNAGALTKEENFYVAFSPIHPETKTLAKQWDDGLRSLRQSGKLGKILERYGVKDWVAKS
jgi:polar amino acid transport system substrate-binding protein